MKKSLHEAINDRLIRWSFDRVVPPSAPVGAPIEVPKDGEIVIKRLLAIEPPGIDYPAALLDDTLINLIVGWHGSHAGLYIGAHEELSIPFQVEKWVRDEIAFGIFENDVNGNKGQQELLGFVTAVRAELSPNYVEIGRLLVDTAKRREGLGQAILSNIASLIASIPKELSIFARVYKGNMFGIEMMRDIRRFKEVETLDAVPPIKSFPPYRFPTAEHLWFRWEEASKRETSTFGEVFKRLRVERALTQQIIAQRAGITREAINQIERNGMPSHENLPKLIDALSLSRPLTTESKTRLVFSLYGYDVPSQITFSSTVENYDHQASFFESKWTISDSPIELVDPDELERTIIAIMAGHRRFFFVPRSGIDSLLGIPLCRQILKTIAVRIGKRSPRLKQVSQLLRLYIAPSELCRLRITIFGSELYQGHAKPPRGITIAGPNDERIDLGRTQATKLFDDLCDSIRPSFHTDHLLRTRMPLRDGFELIPASEILA